MSDEPALENAPLKPGTVFNLNGRYRCVLFGTRFYQDVDETYFELQAGPADGISGPAEQTRFQLWIGTKVKITSRFTGQEITLVVTSVDVQERRSDTPDDPERSISASIIVRMRDVLEVQRARDFTQAQRDVIMTQAKRFREDDTC